MKIYARSLKLLKLLESKSHFLFGPRSTGKSTLIGQDLVELPKIDLLDAALYREIIKRPSVVEDFIDKSKIIIIDEVQKIPSILDEVHRLIFERDIKFLLTGSSARKLKRGGANLLAGRAWLAEMFPLTSYELGEDFDLLRYLNTGGLPNVYISQSSSKELIAYTGFYLKEEIQEEAVVRQVHQFSEFLDLLALSNGEEINFQNFASDCGLSVNTIRNYFEILDDTMLGFQLPAFRKTKKRKAISRSKFYFFDLGVANSLANRTEILPKSELFGKAFEHFIVQELRAFNSYRQKNFEITYWRSTSQFKVDLILGNEWAFEIKSAENISTRHIKGLKALREEGLIKKYGVICLEPRKRQIDGIEVLPWKEFLNDLWGDALF